MIVIYIQMLECKKKCLEIWDFGFIQFKKK